MLRVQEAGREEGVLLPLPKGSFFFLLETLCTYWIILYSRGSCGLFGGRTPPPRKCACPCSAPCCHNPSGDMSSVQTKCRWSLALGGAPPNPHLLGHFLGSQGPPPLTSLPGVYVNKAESWLNRRWPDPDSDVGPSVQLRRLRGGSLAKATQVMRPRLDSGLPDPKAGLSPLLTQLHGLACVPTTELQEGALCHALVRMSPPQLIHLPIRHPPTSAQPCVTLSVHMPTPLKPTQGPPCFLSQPIHTRWVCQPAAEPHPLGGRCAWGDRRGPQSAGPRCWERGGLPSTGTPPTHTHGRRPRWRVPPRQLSGAALGSVAPAAG